MASKRGMPDKLIRTRPSSLEDPAAGEKSSPRKFQLADSIFERLQLQAIKRRTNPSTILGEILNRELPRLEIIDVAKDRQREPADSGRTTEGPMPPATAEALDLAPRGRGLQGRSETPRDAMGRSDGRSIRPAAEAPRTSRGRAGTTLRRGASTSNSASGVASPGPAHTTPP